MKANLKNVRLHLSALEAAANKKPIAEHHLQEIVEARETLTRGHPLDVMNDVHQLLRSGISILIDVTTPLAIEREPDKPRQWRAR